MFKISKQIRSQIQAALREDIGRGDMTTETLIPIRLTGEAKIRSKSAGILCGGSVVREVFKRVDPRLRIVQKIKDGRRVSKNREVFLIRGRVASILKAERVALNLLGHLSGIATLTGEFVRKTKGTHAKIYDTRKTTPLWRELEKYAVRTGGGLNHRFGLWDAILVKDNHWTALSSLRGLHSLAMAARRKRMPIEIEVNTLKQIRHLLEGDFRPDQILLDNFSTRGLRRAVQLVKRKKYRISLEASGGISLSNVRRVAQTGVDRISIGALTHSNPSLDFSLKLSGIQNS